MHQISGWQDFFLRETLADYESLRAAGRTPYLTIGPWAHTELSVSLEALREGIYWFDAQLKGDTSNLRVNPVRIYVVGSGEWRRMETWPPPSSATQWYLQPERRLALHTATEVNTPDRYVYDPARPTPALGGAFFSARQGGVRDNRSLEARDDVLTFTSPVLDNDLEIMGTPRATLYVQSSVQHTDFFVRLCDVYPDGRSLNVTDGLLRVAPGVGDPQPDGSLRIELALWPTAANFARGHRLRVQVSSGARPRWSRNLGSGEDLGTGTRMACAGQEIFHDTLHPSHVSLPVTNA